MTHFKNENFTKEIAKVLGLQSEITQQSIPLIQSLVENATKSFLQNAQKFMIHEKRQELTFQDFQNSLIYMNLKDIHLIRQDQKNVLQSNEHGIIVSDDVINDECKYIQNEILGLTSIFQKQKIKGRWVYINGSIPKTQQNMNIKSLKQLQKFKTNAIQQEAKKFNVIKDSPLSLLSLQQEKFFKSVINQLNNKRIPCLENGNIKTIFPYLLNYLLNNAISDLNIKFMFLILKNRHLVKSIESHLHQILAYLNAYEGVLIIDVGMVIAKLVNKWGQKYPILFEIYREKDRRQLDYYRKIKMYTFELMTGIDMQIDTRNLQSDVQNKVEMANIFLDLMMKSNQRCNMSKMSENLFAQGYAKKSRDYYLNLNL